MVKIDDVDTTVAIVDGRVAMNAGGDATLRVTAPDRQPLSTIETHATLAISGEDYRAELELDAEQLDALADAIRHAQEGDDV